METDWDEWTLSPLVPNSNPLIPVAFNRPKTSPYIEINKMAIHLGCNFKVSRPRAKSLAVSRRGFQPYPQAK